DGEDRRHLLELQLARLLLQLRHGESRVAFGHAFAAQRVGGLAGLVGDTVGLVAGLLGALHALVHLVAALLVLVGLVDQGPHLRARSRPRRWARSWCSHQDVSRHSHPLDNEYGHGAAPTDATARLRVAAVTVRNPPNSPAKRLFRAGGAHTGPAWWSSWTSP